MVQSKQALNGAWPWFAIAWRRKEDCRQIHKKNYAHKEPEAMLVLILTWRVEEQCLKQK